MSDVPPSPAPAAAPLRVGSVPYLVGRPLDLGLEQEPGIDLTRRVPAELVRGLRDGELDVALVSSIELFRAPGYGYVDGLAVAGDGPVRSVQLFLRKPLEQLERVALDPASRTSQVLAQVVLAARLPGRPIEFVEAPGSPAEADADAFLEIGDGCLRRRLAPGAPPALDLSAEWRALTGEPFVFAVWIVAPGAPIAPHLAAFERSRQVGHAALERLVEAGARQLELAPEDVRHYLREECRYALPSGLARPLELFREHALELGLADPAAVPRALRP
ncbi:MAG: menaquinone biosynthesis protein [Planctomycetota bacterium]|jgi:chorismate dehydratase